MSWDSKYALATEYYHTHGDLLVPFHYHTGGVNLGTWIQTQRVLYNIDHGEPLSAEERARRFHNAGRPLTQEQITRLEQIGMVWDVAAYKWERAFSLCEAYYEEHGNLRVPKHYAVDGVNISHWIWHQRQQYVGSEKNLLTPEQIARLEAIGMVWAPLHGYRLRT